MVVLSAVLYLHFFLSQIRLEKEGSCVVPHFDRGENVARIFTRGCQTLYFCFWRERGSTMHVNGLPSLAFLVGLLLLLPFSSHAQDLSDLPSCAVRSLQRSFSTLHFPNSFFLFTSLALSSPFLNHHIGFATHSLPHRPTPFKGRKMSHS